MLKLKQVDKPLVGLLAALLAVVALALLGPSNQRPNDQGNGTAQQKATDSDSGWWDWHFSPEALFTGIIAVFSGLSFWEFRKSSERQLRAYVVITEIKFRVPEVGGQPAYHSPEPWDVELTLQNYGQTPAFDVRCYTRAHVMTPTEGVIKT